MATAGRVGPRRRAGRAAVVAALLCTTGACGVAADGEVTPLPATQSAVPSATPAGPGASSSPTALARPSATAPATPSPSRAPVPSAEPETRLAVSDGKPRTARLTIPALDIEDLVVRPHRGSPDDAGGTKIQDGGIAASPYGPDGGVGPGGIGNYIVTAHRLSSTQAFLELPDLGEGDEVHLEAGGQRYTYEIVDTRITSFRSEKSLAEQSAPVPGRPGVRATQAMITLSTCRTPEDRAEGNYWSDEFGNPENRIDKIGELVAVRPA